MVSYLATATLAISLLSSTAKPLEWQADYTKALAATRADDQPLLVVLDEPDAQDARLNPKLLGEGQISGEEFDLLQPYRLCHVDVSSDSGKRVAQAFRTKDFPYTAIIDKTGSVILFSKAGDMAAGEWRELLEKYRTGERASAITVWQPTSRTAYKISPDSYRSSTGISLSPNYCPSCQRRSR